MPRENMSPPFFTIITATYNASSTLSNFLESLVKQTCCDFELIIQDGASTDDTLTILAQYKDKIPHISVQSEKDTGIYDAWNKALLRVQGKWVLFLGADDVLYESDTLARVKQSIDNATNLRAEEGDLLFASGGIVLVSYANIPLRYLSGRAEGGTASLHEAAMPAPFPGLFLHSSLFAVAGFDAGLKIAGDYDFLCKTWKDDRQALRLPFLVTRMQEGGISTQKSNAALCCKEVLNTAEKYFHNGWTREHRRSYQRTRILSALYSWVPKYAATIHSLLRQLTGRTKLAKPDAPLPFFSPTDVPIFIISYNRLSYLQSLITWLEKNGTTNIFVVDNNSTYSPLIAYLDSLPYRVVRLKENMGHLAVWKCGLFTEILNNSYFIVSDPDILPSETCPEDSVMQFYNRLVEYPQITKCGFNLCIDDIPSCYPMRESVLSVENSYWNKPLSDNSGFFAPIDTTFALYRPGIDPTSPKWFEGIRLAPPYTARHLPWYDDPKTMSEETLFYMENTSSESSFWTAIDADSLKRENLELRLRISDLENQVELLTKTFGNQLVFMFYKVLNYVKKKLLDK